MTLLGMDRRLIAVLMLVTGSAAAAQVPQGSGPVAYNAGSVDMPQIKPIFGGNMRVDFRNGCTVRYNSWGEQADYTKPCSLDQRLRADDAIRRYRLLRG